MSGAVAAHAAYNGSGTQGLAVTNKIQEDDGDVISVYWNKNDTTRQLIYGSSFVEVPSAGGSGTNNIGTGSNVIFDVNNDIDCLGDIVLKVLFTNTGSDLGGALETLENQKLAAAVNRVEVQVGTQIWQTFENADIQALAATELAKGAYADYSFQTSGGVGVDNQFKNGVVDGKIPQDGTATAYIPLKLFTKTLAPRLENFAEQTESGYLMGAAPHQQVKIKVYADPTFTLGGASGTLSLSLYAKNQVMCNEEREQMKAMPAGLPKRIKMTQNKSTTTAATAGARNVELDLDNFSLYASHLIISLPKPLDRSVLYNGTAELLLNSSSFSGKLPLGLLKLTGPGMGLFTNEYFVAETEASFARRSAGTYNHDAAKVETTSNTYTFVFPLAGQQYGGSSVPLNRFDNIRLKLNLPAGSYGDATDISVTCVGETTALYKDGAASLAMY